MAASSGKVAVPGFSTVASSSSATAQIRGVVAVAGVMQGFSSRVASGECSLAQGSMPSAEIHGSPSQARPGLPHCQRPLKALGI
jgi:hypothetical protein